MPVQIDMEMPRSCGVCDCLYRHRDMTTGFCPFTGHFVNFGDGREVDCPLVEAKEQKWHVMAEGDLPPKPESGMKKYLITKVREQDFRKKMVTELYWDGNGFYHGLFSSEIRDILAWRELPEPWKGANNE